MAADPAVTLTRAPEVRRTGADTASGAGARRSAGGIDRARLVTRVARWAAAAAGALPVVAYVWVALRRIGYPFELEWLEGGAVEMVRRVVHGQALYSAPSLHYVTYPYTPLYFWVSAAMARVTGVGFLPLRLVSFSASLGCLALIFDLVRRETRDLVAGTVAAGLFAATYKIGLAWLDIGRVDSLALLFVLATVAAARGAFVADPSAGARRPAGRTPRNARLLVRGVAVGALAFCAFFTKQSGLLAVGPVLVLLAVRRPRVGLPAIATVTVGLVGSTIVLDEMTHGWYGWIVFRELLDQGVDHGAVLGFFPHDLLAPLACALVLAAGGLASGLWRRSRRRAALFWAVAAAGMVGSSYVGTLHAGGAGDVLIPAYAAVALLAGIGWAWAANGLPAFLRRHLTGRAGAVAGAGAGAGRGDHRPGRDPDRRTRRSRPAAAVVLTGLAVAQVAMLHYNPGSLVPTAADAAAGRHLVALIRRTPGEVLVYDHPWYETMAGKPSFAQGEAVHDVLRAGPSVARTDLLKSIRSVLATPAVTTVLVDGHGGELDPYLATGWDLGPPVFSCARCFFPPSDLATRPALLYQRISAPTTP